MRKSTSLETTHQVGRTALFDLCGIKLRSVGVAFYSQHPPVQPWCLQIRSSKDIQGRKTYVFCVHVFIVYPSFVFLCLAILQPESPTTPGLSHSSKTDKAAVVDSGVGNSRLTIKKLETFSDHWLRNWKKLFRRPGAWVKCHHWICHSTRNATLWQP